MHNYIIANQVFTHSYKAACAYTHTIYSSTHTYVRWVIDGRRLLYLVLGHGECVVQGDGGHGRGGGAREGRVRVGGVLHWHDALPHGLVRLLGVYGVPALGIACSYKLQPDCSTT